MGMVFYDHRIEIFFMNTATSRSILLEVYYFDDRWGVSSETGLTLNAMLCKW